MSELPCRAVLFDLDGVLVDSTPIVIRHWRMWADEHGLDVDAILRVSHGRRTIETMRDFAPQLDVAAEAVRFDERSMLDSDGLVALPGALELLTALPDDAWGVVTSAPREMAVRRLEGCGLPVPAVMVPADEVTNGKPDPEGYARAAGLLGGAEFAVVIEDAPAGIAAGKAAGARVIALTTTHAPEALGAADLIVTSLADLAPVREQGRLTALATVDQR